MAISVFGCLFLIGPLLVVAGASLENGNFPRFPPSGLSLHWYRDMDPAFVEAGLLSLRLAATVTAVGLLIGVPAGIALARRGTKFALLIGVALRSPLQIPGVVVGIALLQFYGLIASQVGWNFLGSFSGLLIAHLLITTPYVFGATVSAVSMVDPHLEEASESLGASRIRTTLMVLLPSIKSAIFAGGFLAFLISFDEVPMTLFLSSAGHATLPVEMFFRAEFSPTPDLYAAATAVTIIAAIVVIVVDRTLGIRQATGNR